MNKRELSERDICSKYITPALERAGWDTERQVREEVTFTAGQVLLRGALHTRGERKRADYLLFYRPSLPLAIIEAKDNRHGVGDGMQQALRYAEALDVPFVFASNGDAFLEHDRTGQDGWRERTLALDAFPSPAELWARYRRWKNLAPEVEEVVLRDYHAEAGGKEPRYYQRVAINRTTEALAAGQKRALLVLATGTGKTYVAFQTIWRLWKTKRMGRVLFLADRNILVDQAIQNDFRPFGDAMVKVRSEADPAYEIYLALYQALTSPDGRADLYRDFPPDFFDLVVVDECHRGSAAANSAWRDVLDHFASAAHLGLTATPKETEDVSNAAYFGEPLYVYSLRQGIEDGYLAPYRVVRVSLDRDVEGWRPDDATRTDDLGHAIDDRVYTAADFDRTLVLHERTRRVAERIAAFLSATDPYAKTIVFCVDTEHADRMRSALTNALSDFVSASPRYVVRITGDDDEGRREIGAFIDPESRYPVIATTSKLLTTGVDTQTVKLIVLDAPIGSMTEFKQIIGRGTRLREDVGKTHFTILDFRANTDKFADPDFDGEPVQILTLREDDPAVPDGFPASPDEAAPLSGTALTFDPDAPDAGPRKRYVGGVEVQIAGERVQLYGPDGRLITESLRDYTRARVGERFASLDDFLATWSEAERKAVLLDELRAHGVFLDDLARDLDRTGGVDPLDLVLHVVYDRPIRTRAQRAQAVRDRHALDTYGPAARAVLDALLDTYADAGIASLESANVLDLAPLPQTFGRPLEIIRRFGTRDDFDAALRTLETELYRDAA